MFMNINNYLAALLPCFSSHRAAMGHFVVSVMMRLFTGCVYWRAIQPCPFSYWLGTVNGGVILIYYYSFPILILCYQNIFNSSFLYFTHCVFCVSTIMVSNTAVFYDWFLLIWLDIAILVDICFWFFTFIQSFCPFVIL